MAAPKKNNGFPTYDIKVLLNGNLHNEVRKAGVTAPQAILYASIHGPDSVKEVVETGNTLSHTDAEERNRLRAIFEISPDKIGFIGRMFGPMTMPLPREFSPEFSVDTQVSVGSEVPPELAAAFN